MSGLRQRHKLDKAIWVERGQRRRDTGEQMCRHKKADLVIVEPKRGLSCNEARGPRKGRFLFFSPQSCSLFLLFPCKGDVKTRRCFLSRGSKEIGQSLVRMCSPNCLTGPPISTYFASPPTSHPLTSARHPDLLGRRGGFFLLLLL